MTLTDDERTRLERAAAELKVGDSSRVRLLRHVEHAVGELRGAKGGLTTATEVKDRLVEIHDAAQALARLLKEHWQLVRVELPINDHGDELEDRLWAVVVETDLVIGQLGKPGPKSDTERDGFERTIVLILASLGVPLPKYADAPWVKFLEEAFAVAAGRRISRQAAVKRLRETVDHAKRVYRNDSTAAAVEN